MTKFYAIMIDCIGKNQCSKINEIEKKYNFTSLQHISAGSTTFSCFELFNGNLPSTKINDGVGYLSFGDGDALTKHANRQCLELYKKLNKYDDDWKFLKNKNSNLFNILNNNNIKSIVHNSGWVGKFIKAKNTSLHYTKEDLKEFDNIFFDYPPFLSEDFLKEWGGFRSRGKLSRNYEIINQYYEYEKKYIKELQEKKEDLFFYVDDNIYHDINDVNSVSKFLDMWDFNEPDSVFFIFTDHYNTNSRLFPEELWSVWGMIKDNRKNKSKIDTSVFSSCDLYNTVLDVFNINQEINFPIISKSIFTPLNKERIYYKEDSRLNVCCFSTDTFNALKVIEWDNNTPKKLIKLTYIKGKTPNETIDTDIEGIYQVTILNNYNKNIHTWNNSSIYPCNLTNLSNSFIDSQIKLLANGLKHQFNIKDLTNIYSFKKNLLNRIITNGHNFWLITPNYKRILNISQSTFNANNIILLPNEIIESIPNYNNNNIEDDKKNIRSNEIKYIKNYNIPSEESLCLFNIYNNKKYKTILHVIGDSHTALFNGVNKIQPKYPEENGKINNIDSIPYIKTYRINAGTAFHSKKKATPIINNIIKNINKNDYLVFCYGEVDCRAHLIKQFKLQSNRTHNEIIEECVDKLMETILYFKNNNYKIIAYGPPPTFTDENKSHVPIDRWFGTHYERNVVTKKFNDIYKNNCLKHNIKFFTLFYDLVNNNLETKKNVHLNDGMHLSSNVFNILFNKIKKLNLEI